MSWDLDDIFAYKVQRTVRIRDRRLGFIYYSALFFIFVYIVVYNIVIQKGYRKTGDVVGTVRLQLAAPDRSFYRPNRPYCGTGFFPAKDNRPAGQHPCVFWDQYDAVFPAVETTATFLTTRFSRTVSTRPSNCTTMSQPSCAYVPNGPKSPFFVTDPTFFTLFIDHTMNAPTLELSASATNMNGLLTGSKGRQGGTAQDACAPYNDWGFQCPSFVSVGDPGRTDIMAMASLLRAANTNLSDFASTDSSNSLYNETKRYAGVVLLVSIEYDNFFSYDPDDIRYTYAVSEVANTEFKAQQVIPQPGNDNITRTLLDRHGIRVLVQQTGTIGKFDFPTLLVQLVSSLGLLAVATAVVNYVAFNLLPMKNIYKQYQEVTSVDFSDIDHLPKSSLDRFRSEDLINPQPAIFAGVGATGDGGAVMAAGTNPDATKVKKAPTSGGGGSAGGGFFAQLGSQLPDEEVEEGDEDSAV